MTREGTAVSGPRNRWRAPCPDVGVWASLAKRHRWVPRPRELAMQTAAGAPRSSAGAGAFHPENHTGFGRTQGV